MPIELYASAKAHDAALAELFFNLAHRQVNGTVTVLVRHENLPFKKEWMLKSVSDARSICRIL